MVLVVHVSRVSSMAHDAANPATDLSHTNGDLFHSIGGLVVLLVPLVLNIYKPRGLTRYGRRKEQELRDSPRRRQA